MSVFTSFDDTVVASETNTANVPALLDKNWQTTAAVAVACGTGGVTGALMLTAFPAQTLAASATIGGLAYAGHRREQGLNPMPFMDKLSKKAEDKAEPASASKEEATTSA